MKRRSNTLQARELWEMAQSGQFELTANHRELPDHQRISLIDTIEQLRRDPNIAPLADELSEYLNGNYRDALRRLERTENPSHLVIVLLKVTCLLQMEVHNEMIGNTRPREYLRDRILKQIKQLGETDELRVITEWLEAFCFGHELPVEFWSITSK